MRFLAKSVLATGLLAAAAVLAAEATEPTVKARQELMDVIGMNTKTLGDMAKGEKPFDAAAAAAARDAILAASAEIGPKFETQASDPKSTARAEIWTNWEDFLAKASALKVAAEALDASTLEGVQAGMGGLGGACGACHKAYRS